MATFNYILGNRKNDGRYPIYLKICNGKSNTKRSLEIYVASGDWKPKKQRISVRKTDDYDTRCDKEHSNDFLDSLMANAKDVEQKLKKRGVLEEMTAKMIMDAILDYSPNAKQVEGSGDFVQYWEGIAMETPKSQTKYQYALKTLIEYQCMLTGRDYIRFGDITTDWVRGYLANLQFGHQYVRGTGKQQQYRDLSAWSVKTYMGCFKKVLNCAVDAGKLSADVMRGFRNFKSKVVGSSQPSFTLTIEQLRELLHYPFQTMRQRMVRDLFIFSACTMGMNLTDIYHISKKSIKWGDDCCDINYIRNKTGKHIRVQIYSHASSLQKLIAPYCSSNKRNMWNKSIDSTRYFGFDNNYLTYYTFRGNIQKVVRQIREIMGYDDSFTFYTARDSWTTIMHSDYQLDPVYTDVGLGHSTKSLAGAHYTNPNVDKLCECHADMLQLLFE